MKRGLFLSGLFFILFALLLLNQSYVSPAATTSSDNDDLVNSELFSVFGIRMISALRTTLTFIFNIFQNSALPLLGSFSVLTIIVLGAISYFNHKIVLFRGPPVYRSASV